MDYVVPETELARIERWCREQVPAHARHQVRIECAVAGRDVVISEAHLTPRFLGPDVEAESDWLSQPVARLRYLKSRGIWRLYWVDSNDRWHEYPDLPWAHDVPTLLAEIDRDPTALFWG